MKNVNWGTLAAMETVVLTVLLILIGIDIKYDKKVGASAIIGLAGTIVALLFSLINFYLL